MRKQNQIVWFVLIAVAILFNTVQADDWERLGVKTVRHSVDRDVILVGAKEGTFTAIKLAVSNAGLHILDMKVYFVNEDVMDVKIRKFIARGGETRVIDLPGKDRRIEKVVFWYQTPQNKSRLAIVRLWGRH